MISFTRHVKEIASSTLTPSCVHQWRSSGKYLNQQLAPILALHSTSWKLVRRGELSLVYVHQFDDKSIKLDNQER